MARDKHGNCLLNGVMGAIGKDRSLERRDHLRENNLRNSSLLLLQWCVLTENRKMFVKWPPTNSLEPHHRNSLLPVTFFIFYFIYACCFFISCEYRAMAHPIYNSIAPLMCVVSV